VVGRYSRTDVDSTCVTRNSVRHPAREDLELLDRIEERKDIIELLKDNPNSSSGHETSPKPIDLVLADISRRLLGLQSFTFGGEFVQIRNLYGRIHEVQAQARANTPSPCYGTLTSVSRFSRMYHRIHSETSLFTMHSPELQRLCGRFPGR